MVHPNVGNSWHEISANYPPSSKKITDMFIGRFTTDGQYHLLGYRPHSSPYFSAESESNQDMGAVRLPKGKTELKELIEGEIFSIALTGSKKVAKAKHIRFNS